MPPNSIAGLAGRLTDPQDREAYANIIAYIHALPPCDEFRQLSELMGLLSLLGQRVPDALAEYLAELRQLTTTAGEYYGQVDERLAALPEEVAAGIDVRAIATEMSESFRQQLNTTGLEETAVLLSSSLKEITALTGEISTSFKPIVQDYKSMAAAISADLDTVTAAIARLQNSQMSIPVERCDNSRPSRVVLMLAVFLLGGFCGVLFEKSLTSNLLTRTGLHMAHVRYQSIEKR